MPRLQPPKGYITTSETLERLDISSTLLTRYVKEGKLKRYGPPDRKHKFYKESEVEAILHAQQVFEEKSWRTNPVSTFEQATEEDMPTIIDIDTRTFGEPAASLEVCLSWLRKNPHTFYVLRNHEGIIKGYASLIPMDKILIDEYIHDELDGENITTSMVEEYLPGKPLDVYVMAIATDPTCGGFEKAKYGERMVSGLFTLFLDLAQQGVEINSITARSYKKDGLNLLKKTGFTQLKSPVPEKSLFVLQIPESGLPFAEDYTNRLNKWKSNHAH